MPSPLFPSNNRRQSEQQSGNQPKPGLAGYLKKKITDSILKRLGGTGAIIEALLGRSVKKDIAKQLEESEELRKVLEGKLAEKVKETPARPQYRVGGQPEVEADDWRNFDKRQQAVIDGFYPATGSSNVYDFGYEFPVGNGQGSILIRYLAGDSKDRHGPGAMYRYFDCSYAEFETLKRAASKGGWVWDSLRLRGTLAGHQKNFELVDIGELNDIPRAVGLKRSNQGEFFIPRQIGNRRSNKPEVQVRGNRGQLPGYRSSSNVRFQAGGR